MDHICNLSSTYRFDIEPPVDRSTESYAKFILNLRCVKTIGNSFGKGILVIYRDHIKNNIVRIINGSFIGAAMYKLINIETFCDVPLTSAPIVPPRGEFILMDVPKHITDVCWELYCRSPVIEYLFLFATEYEARMTFLKICGEYDMPTNAYIVKHHFQSDSIQIADKEMTPLLPSSYKLTTKL